MALQARYGVGNPPSLLPEWELCQLRRQIDLFYRAGGNNRYLHLIQRRNVLDNLNILAPAYGGRIQQMVDQALLPSLVLQSHNSLGGK
ncbi:hypothetical protein D3C80_2104780 [compost metagenome]